MNVGAILVVALSIASTLSSGLASDLPGLRGALKARAIWAALAVNLVVVPLGAWLVLPSSMFGLLVVAIAPGGGIGPLLALLARGDAAVAGALFFVLSLGGTVVALALTLALEVQLVDMLRASLLVVASAIAPLVVGVAIRRRAAHLATSALPWASRLGALLLVATVMWFALQHASDLASSTLAAAGLLAAASALAGWAAACSAGADRAATIAVVEISLVRNVALALVVVTGVGGEPAAITSVLTYALVMLVGGGAIAVSSRVRGRRALP